VSALYDLSKAGACGKGLFAPAGSIRDYDLSKLVAGYKRTIASRYRAIRPDEVDVLPRGELLVSPKIDGELWFLVFDASQEEGQRVVCVAPNGKVLSGDIPFLDEARDIGLPRAEGQLVLAGELFAIRKGARPRHGDLKRAISGGADAEVQRVGFHAFDLLTGGDEQDPGPMPEYETRLEAMRRVLHGGKRVQAIKTVPVEGPDRVRELYAEWVDGGKGEGLVVRSKEIGRTFKLKPVFTLDAAVIGFTERGDEEEAIRSMLLAVMKDDGQFQIIGSCGNMGDLDLRQQLYGQLAPNAIESSYSYASSSGALYRFVRPTLVVEVKVTDVQPEDSAGRPIKRMVLELQDGKWVPVAPMVGVSILHPVLSRVRDDKQVETTDVRATQLLERVFIDDVDEKAEKIERPESEVLRREVWVKEMKGSQMVRKLLLWKTNKDESDPDFPAYVVHWTDYSPNRKDPLKRDVRIAPDEDAAKAIADEMVDKGVKRGWEPA
jgi:hypothetical protein